MPIQATATPKGMMLKGSGGKPWSKPPKRVFFVEDHAVFRRSMELLIGAEPDLELSGRMGAPHTVPYGRDSYASR